MRYRVEILYKNNTFNMLCTNSYNEVAELINKLKLALKMNLSYSFKDIRVYKLIGQYNDENIEIQYDN